MPAKRPASFTVFAILCLVFASLGLLCDVLGLAGQAFSETISNMQPKPQPGQLDSAAMQKELKEKVPGYTPYQWGNLGLSFLLHLLLLATGIGLLRMLPWSRLTCIAYGLLTILMQLGVMVYTIAFITPVVDDLLERQFKAQNAPITVPGWALNLGVIVGALLGMIFAVILLIFALRPAMGQQLAAGGLPEGESVPEPQDYYDEDYQRQRHEPPPLPPPEL
jgi:hypothetical protein